MLLADKGLDTPSDVQMRISNLTKAMDMIALAIARLTEDDNLVCETILTFWEFILLLLCMLQALRDKLCKQQDELKQLFKDAQNSSGLLINVSPLYHVVTFLIYA